MVCGRHVFVLFPCSFPSAEEKSKETAFTSIKPHTTAVFSISSRQYNSCDSSAYNPNSPSSQINDRTGDIVKHENSLNPLNESSSPSDDDQSSKSSKSSLQAPSKISKRAQWMKESAPTILKNSRLTNSRTQKLPQTQSPSKKSSSQSLASSKYNKAHLNKNTAKEIEPSKPLASSGSYNNKYNSHSPTTNSQLSKQTTSKPKHNFQSMLKEKKNSWNALNESTSQSSEEEQLSKTNLPSSAKTKSKANTETTNQINSVQEMKPLSQVQSKSFKNPAEFSESTLMMNPKTYRRNNSEPQATSNLKKSAQSSKPSTISTRYSKQNSKATAQLIQTPQYFKKSHPQQTNSKILLQKELTPKTKIILQPQEDTKLEDFPALPNSENKSLHFLPIHFQSTHQNNQHQPLTFLESGIDGHQTTQLLLLELLNRHNL